MARTTDAITGQPIFHAHRAGLRNVGSYQVSGHPYITGSLLSAAGKERKVSFPYVTKKITVIASGSAELRIHFTSTGSSTNVVNHLHYIKLDSHEDSMEFDVKCKEIYLSAPDASVSFQIYASLTNILTGSMYDITGSGITD